MKSVIGVYTSHEKAIAALQQLKNSGYPTNLLSVIGKAELKDEQLYLHTKDTIEKAEITIGTIAGTVLGLLTGIGVFAIPGLGLLYGAGAFFGVLTGLWGGIVTGGLAVVLTESGMDHVHALRYEQHIKDGKFIVFAQGDEKQIQQAHEILHTQGEADELTK